ncbi:MAG TPA: hypothetical protein ENK08_08010 [Chloroflexi bacterium]|nr:hypothetical protein [Chloroflexota bacterium]
MDARRIASGTVLLAVCLLLVGCTSLPRGAKEAVLSSFIPEEEPRILSAHRAHLLPEDATAGVEEVWCVEVAFQCWSCPYGEWRTCVSGYLVRRLGDRWESMEMQTEEEWAGWEARGCPQVPESP